MQISLNIEISEEEIKDLVAEKISDAIVEKFSQEKLSCDGTIARGIRDGMDKVVQDMLYAHKDEIIDRVVERASTEMVRKGMPKLLSQMTEAK